MGLKDLSDYAKAKVLDNIINDFAEKFEASLMADRYTPIEELYKELLNADAVIDALDRQFKKLDALIDLEVQRGEANTGAVRE